MKNMVQNVPESAWSKKIWVVTEIDNELWFYGAWDEADRDKANEIALELGKLVLSE